jgi:hypothetical protein
MELNLKDFKRKTLKITFTDDKVINVISPKKGIYDSLDELERSVSEAGDGSGIEVLGPLYKAVASILSANLEEEKITGHYLEQTVDIEQLKAIIEYYMEFAEEVASSKNWTTPQSQ